MYEIAYILSEARNAYANDETRVLKVGRRPDARCSHGLCSLDHQHCRAQSALPKYPAIYIP